MGSYRWELREGEKTSDNYIVPNGGENRHYVLELLRERSWIIEPFRQPERCYPIFDLANALLDEAIEKELALAFVERYGLPNDYTEMSLKEFHKLAWKYDEFFTKLSRGEVKTLTISPPPRQQRFDNVDGNSWHRVESFKGLCLIQAQALYELRREIRRCDFCKKWYALERTRGAGRGAASPDQLRFCPYGRCRQKAKATNQ